MRTRVALALAGAGVVLAGCSDGGGATSLVTADDEAVAGSLDFSNGALDRNGLDGEVIAFDIDGTLSADGATYDVEGRAFGDFLGEDYDYAVALGGGVASEQGVGEADVLGAFIGER